MTAATLPRPGHAPGSATTFVRAIRTPIVAAIVTRALLAGGAAWTTALLGVAIADAVHPLSLTTRLATRFIAVAAGVSVTLAFLWRDRQARSLDHIALWLEERVPALDYALVTQLELERQGRSTSVLTTWPQWRDIVAVRALRALVVPVVIAIAALAATALLPGGSVARVRAPRVGDALLHAPSASPTASRLTPLVATIQPPAYSGLARAVLDDPSTLAGLAGSEVILEGRAGGSGITARLGDAALGLTSGSNWSVRFRMPARASVVTLRDRSHERLIALEPRVDAPPVVVLSSPTRDSVLRRPTGTVTLAAHATDDFGLASANFEVILSSGEGESFTFRTLTLGSVRPVADSSSIGGTLALETLGLKPGDLLHIRAVARDRNDVTGPGFGASETRTLRIARAGEYDSVAVESASAPPEEQSVVSQRMLIMLTEALERRRPKLARATVLDEASHISTDQKRLRRTVAEVIFSRLGEPSGEETKEDEAHERLTPDELLKRADEATDRLSGTGALDFEGGETPVVAVNRPLLEAYRAMWDATMALDQGEPGRALPPMRVALAAIERARQAERIYLRGRPPAAVVDIEKVRLAARETVTPAPRAPRASLDSARARLARRFANAVSVLSTRPAAAVDSLLLLRIDALDVEPRFATALNDLVSVLRRGQSAQVPRLSALARRSLDGAPRVRDSLGTWSVAP
jgi:uncharacterized protein DUF4175